MNIMKTDGVFVGPTLTGKLCVHGRCRGSGSTPTPLKLFPIFIVINFLGTNTKVTLIFCPCLLKYHISLYQHPATQKNEKNCIFFGRLEYVGHSFSYVAHLSGFESREQDPKFSRISGAANGAALNNSTKTKQSKLWKILCRMKIYANLVVNFKTMKTTKCPAFLLKAVIFSNFFIKQPV